MRECDRLRHILAREVDRPETAKAVSSRAKGADALGLESGGHLVERRARDLEAVLGDPRREVEVCLHTAG